MCLALAGAIESRRRFEGADESLHIGDVFVHSVSGRPPESKVRAAAARRQLARARAVWGRLRKVIEKENVPAPVAGMFYQAVVESWVLPDTQLLQ